MHRSKPLICFNTIAQGHRGSSPQIRAFGPDGRTTMTSEHCGGLSGPRSPSPMRAISLDARSSSTVSVENEMRGHSPSQSSLASLTSSGTGGGSTVCLSPRIAGRCLSPLLIPPRSSAGKCSDWKHLVINKAF